MVEEFDEVQIWGNFSLSPYSSEGKVVESDKKRSM